MKFSSESKTKRPFVAHPPLAGGCFINTGEPKRSKAIRAPAWDGKQNWHYLYHRIGPHIPFVGQTN
jgi:hypothetical protein